MSFNPLLPHYTGDITPNCDYHHGQVFPARGVKCRQVSRATRDITKDDKTGCTYKHAADIAYWKGKFYIQYLCNPKDEHVGAGVNVLATSQNGADWDDFQISFPPYLIKECEVTDYKGEKHSFDGTSYAFIHHRMCFYKASDGRMLLLSFYGWSPQPWVCNWDNYGIGRVVRELYPDETMGEIYFIRPCYQGGWTDELLNYPLYTQSKDKGFVVACEELLKNKLYVQQWAEENGDSDELITIKHPKKGVKNEAFCWYHTDENAIIGLWKHSRAAKSCDNGATWSEVERCPSLVMSGQKVWGCKTSDGKYAMVYDPTMETQHRYPMCVTTSSDGVAFDNMALVHGEVPPMRYEGFWKDLGPQYMRGICEGIDTPPDGNLWVAYSVNKEDIWVSEIPVPIISEEQVAVEDCFETDKTDFDKWNTYSPILAKAQLLKENGKAVLSLSDSDPYDYSKAERILKSAEHMIIKLSIIPKQDKHGELYIEACDAKLIPAVRLIFRADGNIYARTVAELKVAPYKANERYEIELDINCETHLYTIAINGETLKDKDGDVIDWKFMAATSEISRLVLRTGAVRTAPTLDYIPDNKPEIPLEDDEVEKAEYCLEYLKEIVI